MEATHAKHRMQSYI